MRYIPYGRQSIDSQDIEHIVEVLKSDWVTQGPKIKEFEDALCRYSGAKFAVAVSSGTAALHIAALVAGIKQEDEVITSPITFVASANCILYCGARPVFADIEKDTINVDPAELEKKITKKTRAIIAVHFAGRPVDLGTIYKIARKHNLIVIEDACHALGAKYRVTESEWVRLGSCKHSDMAVFSFHPVKHITTGEGGLITTNNRQFYEKLQAMRIHGVYRDTAMSKQHGCWYYEMRDLGFNYRITDFQCALGLSQLKKLDAFIEKRRDIVKQYDSYFKDNPYFELPPSDDSSKLSSWHLYPVRLKDKYVHRRAFMVERLREKGLGVQVHYIPVYFHPFYQRLGYKRGSCVNAEDFYQREISLPLYPSMSAEDITYVVDTVLKVFEDAS